MLTKGGYTRYREKTATVPGGLATFLEDKYGMHISSDLIDLRQIPKLFSYPTKSNSVQIMTLTISLSGHLLPRLRSALSSKKSKALVM